MSRGPHVFTLRELSRLIRSAVHAGHRVERIEHDPATGKISVIVKDETAPPAAAGGDARDNPWNEVLTNAADEKRPA